MEFNPTAATSSPATAFTASHFNSLHTQTPPSTHPTTTTKSFPFTNGTLKRRHTSPSHTAAPSPSPATYKECLKNHAAAIGGHALDGCGEFMPSSAAFDPRSLKCAACGCHRNFHRREAHQELPSSPTFLSCFFPPLPPPLAPRGLSPSPSSSPSPGPGPSSPSPLSSPSPPVMPHFPPPNYHTSSGPPFLVALGGPSGHHHRAMNSQVKRRREKGSSSSGSKRHRTKFSHVQKEKMFEFSEELGWRIQRSDDKKVDDFCNEVGVTRGVFKVWMHNNKNTYGKKSENVGNNVQIENINNNEGHVDDANNEDDHRSGDDGEGGSRINLQFSVN